MGDPFDFRFSFELWTKDLSFSCRHTFSPLGLLSPLESVRQIRVGLG